MYAELIIVQCVTVRGGVMVTAAVRAGAMGDAGAAMRAAVRTALNLLARVALRGGAFEMAARCVGALVQAASAMYAAAHTSSRAQGASCGSHARASRPPHRNVRSSLVLVQSVQYGMAGSGNTGAYQLYTERYTRQPRSITFSTTAMLFTTAYFLQH